VSISRRAQVEHAQIALTGSDATNQVSQEKWKRSCRREATATSLTLLEQKSTTQRLHDGSLYSVSDAFDDATFNDRA